MVVLERKKFYDVAIPPDRRANALLSAYNLVLTVKSVRVEIGRFSYGLVSRIKFLPHRRDELVLKVGAFCEAASATIVVGGEHRNDNIFNYSFSSGTIFKHLMEPDNLELADVDHARPIRIGNNVLLSEHAVVLGGADIGDGSIIGAGAVVTGQCDAYGRYAGVPARLLAPRFSDNRFRALHERARLPDVAAHDVNRLPTLLHRLQTEEMTLEQYAGNVSFLPARPVVEFGVVPQPGDRIALGKPMRFLVDDHPVEDDRTIDQLHKYFAQISSSDTKVRWTPDIFDSLGLYGSE